MTTDELAERVGASTMTLHRLVYAGILTPAGPGGRGSRFMFSNREQRAAAAVVAFQRSHLLNESARTYPLRPSALRAVAECARTHDPDDSSVRWIMLLPDGTALRVSDEQAAAWPEPRTLIPLDAA